MKKIINWVKENPNRSMFLLPIILVAGISISHVVSWYDIANPFSWAIYLSIAIEVGAMTALVAATNKIKGGVWFMFGLITFIQMIGNIFYSYKEIDQNGNLFKSWVELTGPIWEMIGSDTTDVSSMKRWLAFLEGGLLPIISLTSLHFFVKYEKSNDTKVDEKPTPEKNYIIEEDDRINQLSEIIENIPNVDDYNSRLRKDAEKVFETIKKLKKEGKIQEPTEEDILNEPSSLANSEYRLEENVVYDNEEDHNITLIEEEHPENEIIIPEKEESQEIEQKLGPTLGEELSKTWKNIIKNRNNNNNITRL